MLYTNLSNSLSCRKVFRKLNFELSDDVIKSMCQCKAFTVERVLLMLRTKIDRAVFEQNRAPKRGSDKPEADQNKGKVLFVMQRRFQGSALIAEWSKELPLTAAVFHHCPVKICLKNMRKLQMTSI